MLCNTGHAGLTLLYFEMAEDDSKTISCTILDGNDDEVLLAAVACFMRRRLIRVNGYRSNNSCLFVGGVREPFPDDQGNVLVVDARNNKHRTNSNWQFI